jgi:UDP-glucose 4-epimerase
VTVQLLDAYRSKMVLVTGAAGFIGSHLVQRLLELGATVRAADRLPAGDCVDLAPLLPELAYRRTALAAGSELDELIGGVDIVFHLAGNADVALSAKDPEHDFNANVVATFNVLDAVRRAGAGTLFFVSTGSVYGEPQRVPMDEGHPLRPQSPYAGHKLAAEVILGAHARCYGVDARVVRLFSTFGPRQRKYVMFDLLEKLRRDPEHLEVLGTGEQVRAYSYIADTVDAFLLVACHPQARGRTLNVGGEQPISIRELVELVIAATGIPRPQVVYTGQSWEGDVIRLYGDARRLADLGFVPRFGFAEGLRHLVAWHRHEYGPPW